MLKDLDNYYVKNKISAKGNVSKLSRCDHYEMCSMKKPFFPAKEAFVSTKYEEHKIPRLLIISLDPKPSPFFEKVENRTLLGIREHEEFSPDERYFEMESSTHWKKTFDMVFLLLRDFINSRKRDEVRQFFAHTNSAKCHDNARSNQASDLLFANCSEYLPGEITILNPDIIVTQGNLKYFQFMSSFPNNPEWRLPSHFVDLKKVHPIVISDHKAIWIESNHPCRHDSSYQNEDVVNFSRYRELINEFWKNKQ